MRRTIKTFEQQLDEREEANQRFALGGDGYQLKAQAAIAKAKGGE